MEFERFFGKGEGIEPNNCNPCQLEGAICSEWINPEAPCTCWEVVSLWHTQRQDFQHTLVFYADQPKQECLKVFYRGNVKLWINRKLKITSRNWTWSAFFEVKVIRMEQTGIYRLHRLWEGLQKHRGDRGTYFFQPCSDKNATWFQCSCNNRKNRRTKSSNFSLCSHPCVSLTVFYSGHSPQMHLQQSTQLINTDKISVNTQDRETGTTRTIFKL